MGILKVEITTSTFIDGYEHLLKLERVTDNIVFPSDPKFTYCGVLTTEEWKKIRNVICGEYEVNVAQCIAGDKGYCLYCGKDFNLSDMYNVFDDDNCYHRFICPKCHQTNCLGWILFDV